MALRKFAPEFRGLAAAALLAGCVGTPKTGSPPEELTPGDPSAPSQVTPREALDIARQLPSVCSVLSSAQDLHPGDLLDIPHRHVLLCAGWATPDHQSIYFYETGGAPDYWKPGLKQASLDRLLALGYQPLRYRGMATGAQTDGKQVLTRAVRTAAAVVVNPVVGEP